MLQGTIDQLTALGNAIRIQRKKLKVTVVTAAESAGLSRVTWHRIEKGEPSVSAGAYFSALVPSLDYKLVCKGRCEESLGNVPISATVYKMHPTGYGSTALRASP